MSAEERNDIWKKATVFLAGIVTAGTGFYLTEGRSHATMSEVRTMVETLSPYKQDKGTIFTRLDAIQEDLRDIKEILKTR